MKFVVGEAAAVVGKNLVVSDAHVGIELELQAKGIEVSNYEREAQRLNKLLKQTKCTRIVVLGDFKHDFYGFKNREFWVLKKFLRLLHCKDILVVKGNHDSELENFGDVKVVDAKGLLLEAEGKKYGLFHGHAFPSREITENADVFLFGNLHPLVEISEGERFSYTAPVWVVGKTKANAKHGLKAGRKWVLFPAFGSLVGGVAVNKTRDLGPFLKKENAELQNAQVFTIDGRKLGTLENLR
ncbi:MAG: metallophosphoesterase family protein [Candidatus Norongarragalinales archaeon]